MGIIREENVKIQPLYPTWHGNRVMALDMLRLDLLHPIVSGNKWYKLRLNILYAQEHHLTTVLTFGGGYSNHLVATAYAAQKEGLRSIGIVRGRHDVLTPTLLKCKEYGMHLIFVTREDYNRKEDHDWVMALAADFDNMLIIPEGGDNERGRKGAELICKFISRDYTHIAVSVGSGTTLTGLRNRAHITQHLLGFAPMKEGAYLEGHVAPHLHPGQDANWKIYDQWHFGGFGKCTDELIDFMNDFYTTNQIPLDRIYTAKMMYGLREMLASGNFAPNARILCVHTGGLQGNAGIQERLLQPVAVGVE